VSVAAQTSDEVRIAERYLSVLAGISRARRLSATATGATSPTPPTTYVAAQPCSPRPPANSSTGPLGPGPDASSYGYRAYPS
jgi:hypothetical protein